ncbi:hypothetical protein ACFE04_012682 [Oxalis oulophora]
MGKKLKNSSRRQDHSKEEDDSVAKPLDCPYCKGRSFTTNEELQKHNNLNHLLKTSCGKTMSSLPEYNRHTVDCCEEHESNGPLYSSNKKENRSCWLLSVQCIDAKLSMLSSSS